MQTLVLWDIDHTLVDIGGLSRDIYASTFERVTGRRMEELADMTGQTDRAIITETLRLHGIAPTEGVLLAFADELASQFAAKEELIKSSGRMLPGASATLRTLGRMDGTIQSVLTGNMKSIAVLKLTAFSLLDWLDCDVGAFGMDDDDRAALVSLARKRATDKYGVHFDKSTIVLIGDTPNDVRAGHEGGARVVAIASGSSDTQVLKAAGADVVFSDLTDTQAIVNAVLSIGGE